MKNIIELYKTKAAFCRAVGIKPQFLTQIENGKRPISPKMAININRLHGVPLHELRPDIYPEGFKSGGD